MPALKPPAEKACETAERGKAFHAMDVIPNRKFQKNALTSFLVGLSFFVSVFTLRAADKPYKIIAVDFVAHTITIKIRSEYKTYQVGLAAEITVNGLKASFSDLKEGMTVSLVTAGSNSVAGIAASGAQKFPSVAPPVTGSSHSDDLAAKLSGTVWKWPDPKARKENAWFILNPDGTTNAGWHRKKGAWRVIAESTIELHVTINPGSEILRFNEALTQATQEGADDWVYTRIK